MGLPLIVFSVSRLFSDGSIEITDSGQGLNLSSENYCVNFFGISGDGQELVDENFFICVQDDEEVKLSKGTSINDVMPWERGQ